MTRLLVFVFTVLAVVFHSRAAAAQAPEAKSVTVRGRIAAVERQILKIRTTAGEVQVRMPDNVRIGGVDEARLSGVTAGSYVGTTAVKQADGTLRAIEVHIFPESARGAGDGHRPWDLQPGSTMTNGNVEKIETVMVDKVQGQMLTVKYKDGQQNVFVPPGTPIVKSVPGSSLLLRPGTGVFITGTRAADGTVTAARITAGLNGIMPPM